MILQSVTLESWRCFNRLELTGFDPWLNIVHAPNGSGKSSLFEAIRNGFLLNHDSARGEIKSVVPWGAMLGPCVEIDFSDAGVDYRLKKKFLVDKKSELMAKKGMDFAKISESKHADEAILNILDRALDTGKKEKWLLSKILLAHQGRIELDSLSDDLQRNIRTVLSAQVGGTGVYEEMIQTLYLKYFTPTGREKSGSGAHPELSRLKNEIDQAQRDLDIARVDLETFERLSTSVTELNGRISISLNHVKELEANQQDLEDKKKKYDELLRNKQTCELEIRNEELSFRNLDLTIKDIDRYSRLIAETGGLIKELQDKLPEKQAELEQAMGKHHILSQQVATLKSREEVLSSQRNVIQAARDYVRIAGNLNDLQARKVQTEGLRREIQSLNLAKSALNAPDRETLSKIKELHAGVTDISRKLEMSQLRLELIPEEALTVEVTSDGQNRVENLNPGLPVGFSGAGSISARIPGVMAIKVSGPEISVEREKADLQEFKALLEEASAPFSDASVTALEQAYESSVSIDAKIQELTRDMTRILDKHDYESMLKEMESLSKRSTERLVLNPEWSESFPDPEKMDRENQEALELIRPELAKLEPSLRNADLAIQKLKTELEQLPKDLKTRETDLASYAQELKIRQQDGKTTESRSKELESIAIKLSAASVILETFNNEIRHFGENPGPRLESLSSELKGARELAGQLKDDLVGKQALLGTVAEKAPYTTIAYLEEKLGHLKRNYDRELLRQDAIKLLNNTLIQRREEALSGITEPVESRAADIMQRIGDSRFKAVSLKQNFVPESILPQAVQAPVSLDNISGGESEQLHLAVRLALAETLVRDERHFMLLDDVLTATDAQRMDRILEILSEMTQRFQVIIMTCHPERYRSLESARFIDLLAV